MTTARKPRLVMYWSPVVVAGGGLGYAVNWRLLGINGKTLCQCTQGFRDKTDAMRNVDTVVELLTGGAQSVVTMRIVGPGRKPK